MPNTKGFPAISFTNKNGYIYRTVVDKNGNIDLKRRAVYKLYKTGNKVKDDKGKEIDEIKLCKLVYNDKFKNYIPKYLAKNATILKEKDVEEFNTYVSGEASAMPLAWKNDFNNIRAHDEICTIDNLPPKLQSEVRQHPQYLQYGIRNFIKVDSGGEVEDETYIAYGYKNTIVPLCYKKNGDDWQNIAQNTYDNIIVYEDGFTYASPQLSNKEAINAQIYVPETEFYSPYAEQFSQNMLGRNGHKDRKGCNFQIETHTAGKRNAAISSDIVRQNQQIMQNTFDGKDTDNGFIRESPLRIISGDGKNLQCVITDKMDTNQVQDIVKRHNVGRVLIAAHQNSQQELSESFTKQTQEYQQHGQELLRQVQQERAQNTNGKIQNYEQELLYQCYLDPKLFQTLWHVSISLAEDLLTGLFNLPDIDDPNEEKQIKNDMLKYLNNLNQNQKRDLLKKAKKIVDRDKEYHEQELKLLPNNCLNLQNYANRGTCTLYDNIPTAPIADGENNYFYSFNENNKGANELFVNNPKDYDEDVSDLMATMYFINPAPDVDTLDAINSMTINCCVPDLPQMFSNRQKEYTVSSLEVGKRDVCITPINTNSKLVFSHAIDKFSTKGKCGIIKKDKSVQKDLPFPATGAVIHFSDDTIVVINNVEDESTIHIKIFPNDKLKQTLTTGNNKLDTHWKEGDYVDIVLEDDKAELAIRNANYAGFSDDKKEYPRQIDLSDKAAEIMPALKAYRLNSLLRSVPQYISPVAPLKLYKTDNSLISGKENIFSGNFKFTEVKNRKGQELKPKQLSLSPLSSDSPTINTNILNERYILMPELNHDFEKRIAQLNSFQNAALIPILYEDSTNGKISDDNFIKNRKNYIKFHDDIRQNFLQKFKEIRNEVERLRNGVQREIEGSKNEDALKNIAKNSLKEIFLSSLKGAKFSPESSLDKKLQQDLSEELKTLYSDLKIDEENGMTNVARVADYARQVSEELMRSADEQITKQQKCIKNLHPLALESYNSKQSPRIIGQQYLRLLAYENALQHTKQRQTSGIDTEPDLNFKSFLHEEGEINTIITDHKQKVAELDKKYRKSNEILDKYSELLEKVIWQVEKQPKSTLEEKQDTIYEYGALVQAMMLVDILMDKDPNNNDKQLEELQTEIAKSSLLYGSVLPINQLNDDEPTLDCQALGMEKINTLKELSDFLSNKLQEYDNIINDRKNILHTPLKPKTEQVVITKEKPKNVTPPPSTQSTRSPMGFSTSSPRAQLKMALHASKDDKNVIIKFAKDKDGKLVKTYFKKVKINMENGESKYALLEVEASLREDGTTKYTMPVKGDDSTAENTNMNDKYYKWSKSLGMARNLAIDPKDLPTALNKYKTDDSLWIKIDDDTYARWSANDNMHFSCYKNHGKFWQNICGGANSMDDIVAFSDGGVMATSCTRPELNNAQCNFYIPDFTLIDHRAKEYIRRSLIGGEQEQVKGYCFRSENVVPKGNEYKSLKKQNDLLDDEAEGQSSIASFEPLTDPDFSSTYRSSIFLEHPLGTELKTQQMFSPSTLQNISYQKRIDEYNLPDIYKMIQQTDYPELDKYEEAVTEIKNIDQNRPEELEQSKDGEQKYKKYKQIILDHDRLHDAYATSPIHPLGNGICALSGGIKLENDGVGLAMPSIGGTIIPNYAEPQNYGETPTSQASGEMYYIDPLSWQNGPSFFIAHRNINGDSTKLSELYGVPVNDVMIDLECKTCTALSPSNIYTSLDEAEEMCSYKKLNKMQVQLKKSDGSLSPNIPLEPRDALIKFNDDTIAHFVAQTGKASCIRIFPSQKLFNQITPLLKDMPMEDGDFIEISISDPPHLLLKNHKDAQLYNSENIGQLVENQRGIDLSPIAVFVMKELKDYRLNSLARSCGAYTDTNVLFNAYVKDEQNGNYVVVPPKKNIFDPSDKLFQTVEVPEGQTPTNKISLQDKFLNTNFNTSCFAPNSLQKEKITYNSLYDTFKDLCRKDTKKYIYSFASWLNTTTSVLVSQLDAGKTGLNEELVKLYEECTKCKTTLTNILAKIEDAISDIGALENKEDDKNDFERDFKEKIQLIYDEMTKVNETIQNFPHDNMEKILRLQEYESDPLRATNSYANYLNMLKLQYIIQIRLEFQGYFEDIIDKDKDKDKAETVEDIVKMLGENKAELEKKRKRIKDLEQAFFSQQNWLMQNALRVSYAKEQSNDENKYLTQCCDNAHATLALQILSQHDPGVAASTMGKIIKEHSEDPLLASCAYFFESKGNIKPWLSDLKVSELLNILQDEQTELTKYSMPVEDNGLTEEKIVQYIRQLTSDDDFTQLVEKKAKMQTTSVTQGTLIDPGIFDEKEKNIERMLSENLGKKHETSAPVNDKNVEECKKELGEILSAKLRLNCANRLLAENKTKLDTTSKQEDLKLEKGKPPISVEDVRTTFVRQPEDSCPHTKIYLTPTTATKSGTTFAIKSTIIDILDDSDPDFVECINQKLKPKPEEGSSNEKWYMDAEQPKYELFAELPDSSETEKFFIALRTHGLKKAADACNIKYDALGIRYIDAKKRVNNKLTLAKYLHEQQIGKPYKKNKLDEDAMLYFLMGNLDKQKMKEITKTHETGGRTY